MKMSDLERKDVVNITDGKIIGKIIDIIINSESGAIENFIIEKSRYLRNMFSTDNIINLKYEEIKKIGSDVILVDLINGG